MELDKQEVNLIMEKLDSDGGGSIGIGAMFHFFVIFRGLFVTFP